MNLGSYFRFLTVFLGESYIGYGQIRQHLSMVVSLHGSEENFPFIIQYAEMTLYLDSDLHFSFRSIGIWMYEMFGWRC